MVQTKIWQSSTGLAVAAVVAVAAAGIGYATSRQPDESKQNNQNGAQLVSAQKSQLLANQSAQAVATAKSTKRYSNEKYGISFEYPQDWTVEEVPNDKPAGVMPVVFGININSSASNEYKNAAAIEIIAKDLGYVTGFYENSYAQSTSAKISKSEDNAKAEQSAIFTINYPEVKPKAVEVKRYLFAVKDKTYSLRTVNEELNIQHDADYGKKIEKMYNSLQLRGQL